MAGLRKKFEALAAAIGIGIAGSDIADLGDTKKEIAENERKVVEKMNSKNTPPVEMSGVKVETMDDIYKRRVDEALANYQSQIEKLFPEHVDSMVPYLARTIQGKPYAEQEQIISMYLADAIKRSK